MMEILQGDYREFARGLIWLAISLVVIACLINIMNTVGKDKGAQGEIKILSVLKQMAPKFRRFSNIYLKKEDGKYTEIDIILVHTKGLFVFESKNYSGKIFGNEENGTWIQNFGGKFGNIKFFNPIMQNKIHIDAIINTLGPLSNVPIFSIVVFGDSADLNDVLVTSENVRVIKLKELEETLYRINRQAIETIPEEKIKLIEKIISDEAIKNANAKEMHRQYIKDVYASEKICPACGAALIQRTNRKTGAPFYGCKLYPECRYTEDTTN